MIDVLIENAGFFPIKMFEAIGAAVRGTGLFMWRWVAKAMTLVEGMQFCLRKFWQDVAQNMTERLARQLTRQRTDK